MPSCPRCLKSFRSERGVEFHLAQPRSPCHDNNYGFTIEVPRLSASPPAEYSASVNVGSPPHSPFLEPLDLERFPSEPLPDLSDLATDEAGVPIENARPFPEARDPHSWVRDYFKGASTTHGRGDTFLKSFRRDRYSDQRQSNPYYPFASSKDWMEANFLSKSRLSMALIDEYLSMDVVCTLDLRLICTTYIS